MPVCYPDSAGEPYQPSNGSEGEMFMESFCYRCKKDSEQSPCEIIGLTMACRDCDPEYPKEWKYDPEGKPTCTAFEGKTQ
jgi:hypothetical protein